MQSKKKYIIVAIFIIIVLFLIGFFLFKSKTQKYSVSFEGIDKQSIVVEKGKKIPKLEDPTKEGYEFVGWYLDGKPFDFSTTVNKDIKLEAKWKAVPGEDSVSVIFDTNGGSEVEDVVVKKKKKISKPTNPTKEGYKFVEWQLDGKKFNFDKPIKKNITLVAIWKENASIEKVKITYMNGSSVYKTVEIQKNNKTTPPPQPTQKGKTFKEWQLDGKTFDFNTKITKNITLTAKWVTDSYTYTVCVIDAQSPARKITLYKNDKEVSGFSALDKKGNKITAGQIKGTNSITFPQALVLDMSGKFKLSDKTVVKATKKDCN